jgi:hypothetical protein
MISPRGVIDYFERNGFCCLCVCVRVCVCKWGSCLEFEGQSSTLLGAGDCRWIGLLRLGG